MNQRRRHETDGSAYGRGEPSFMDDITLVGAGTACGEYLRRYWHPIGLARDAGDRPRKVRALGEDLILFRDGAGRPGLLHARCAHRGTTLYYGRVEPEGIRCCYHGWLFDREGRCLDQPCEPDHGAKHRHSVRQPWYPVAERYGLIFTYMGPPERKPLLPRYDILENLGDGESIEADDSSIGSGGPVIVPCNWMQHFENVMDPFHVPILHGSFSGAQFVAAMGRMPEVAFAETDRGVRSLQVRPLDGGRRLDRITEVVLPTLRVVPDPRLDHYGPASSIGWVLPIDDTSFRIYTAGRVREPGELSRQRSRFGGKTWFELTEDEHQRMPGDFEAQVGQGAITLHSEEHLTSTDRGIAMLRRLMKRQVAAVADGADPLGLRRAGNGPLVCLDAGNFVAAE